MKTMNLNTVLLTLILTAGITILNSNEASAKPVNSMLNDYTTEYTRFEEFISQFENNDDSAEIRIYDTDHNLIATGNAENRRIKKLISRSDLLTEVDNTQYYKLSYDQTLEAVYQFAVK